VPVDAGRRSDVRPDRPTYTEWLKPIGRVFLQASQIVVMPFLICELLVGFGNLPNGSWAQSTQACRFDPARSMGYRNSYGDPLAPISAGTDHV
jgi:hypothetical protein